MIKGDPGYVDKSGDGVDDNYYKGVESTDIEGGQAEYVQRGENGNTGD